MAQVNIALLRAVNVGGSNLVSMATLRELAVELGLGSPRTLLQSGNLVFQSPGSSPSETERVLEAALAERCGVTTDFLVRKADEWRQLIEANPFEKEAGLDPARLLLMCLKAAPTEVEVAALREAIKGPERVKTLERALYIVYPEGVGQSKLTNALIERKLGTRGTARNWNTVLKLAELAAQL